MHPNNWKVKSIAKEVPSLRTVIYFNDSNESNIEVQSNGLTFYSFEEVVQKVPETWFELDPITY